MPVGHIDRRTFSVLSVCVFYLFFFLYLVVSLVGLYLVRSWKGFLWCSVGRRNSSPLVEPDICVRLGIHYGISGQATNGYTLPTAIFLLCYRHPNTMPVVTLRTHDIVDCMPGQSGSLMIEPNTVPAKLPTLRTTPLTCVLNIYMHIIIVCQPVSLNGSFLVRLGH